MALYIIGAVLLGACLGSFANVVIYRAPRGISVVTPPSACPTCEKPILRRHNIPVVGWLWLRGRCANCREPISARYPSVEALMALAFGVIAAMVGLTWAALILAVLAFFTVVLSAIDLETMRLPNNVVAPFAIAAGLSVVAASAFEDGWSVAVRALIGAAALGAFYMLAFVVYPRGMGFGDVKLAPVLGLVLAYFGWSTLVVGGFAAFVWGALVGVIAMAVRRGGRRARIPFGPWMFAGAWTGILVGQAVSDWYIQDVLGV